MDAKRYKKKLRPKGVELHPTEPLILVPVETVVLDLEQLDEAGNPVVVHVQEGAKKIRLTVS